MEKFIDIPDFEGLYQISNLGRVKKMPLYILKNGEFVIHTKERFLKVTKGSNGYAYIILYKNGKQKGWLFHRLMATLFIPNPENKPEVNHKDGNAFNFSLENLEWVTSSENQRHAVDTGLAKFLYGDDHPQSIKNGGMIYVTHTSRGDNNLAKLVLDTQTGVFYDCVIDAAEAKCIKSIGSLYQRLRGKMKNKTGLIYA